MPRFRFENLWRISWQTATSDYVLGVVLFTLATALLLAAWLPQTSADALNQDLIWQGEVQRRFGEQSWFDTIRSPLQAIGAFHVGDAIWFRVLLALLAFSLLARLVDSLDAAWKEWPSNSSSQGSEAIERNATDGNRAIARRPGRRFWREVGSAGIYLGGLTILLGAAITSRSSWQTGPLPVTPGDNIALGHGSDLTLLLESLEQDGRRGVGEIWLGGEKLVGSGELVVGQPLTGGGVGAYLIGSGMGLRVQATLSDTQTLELVTGPDTSAKEELILAFTEEEASHLVGVPEADLVLLLTRPESDQTDARPRVQVFQAGSGEFILEQDAPVDTLLTVSDVSFALTPIPYAQVRVIHDFGAFWSQLGALILSAGALCRLWRSWSRHPAGSDAPSSDVDVRPAVDVADTRTDWLNDSGV